MQMCREGVGPGTPNEHRTSPAEIRDRSDPDDDLAEVGAALEVVEGLGRLVEGEDAIDDRAELVQAMARFIASNMAREPTKMPWTWTFFIRIGQDVDLARPAGQDADQADPARHPDGAERLRQGAGSADLDDVVDAPAAGQRRGPRCPSRGSSCS